MSTARLLPRRRHAEDRLQVEVVRWARLMEKWHPALALLMHVPNGGRRSKAEAGRFKAMGVRAGVPDLFLPVPRGGWHGLWIELKSPTGTLRPSQRDMGEKLLAEGYAVRVCRDASTAIETLTGYVTGKTVRSVLPESGEKGTK